MPNLAHVTALVGRIRPLLARVHPAIQGAALADLAAIWLAGHPPSLREDLLANHIQKIAELTLVNASIMGTGR